MSEIKPTSSNQINKKNNALFCPVSFTLDKIGGRWKPIIIYHLLDGTKRYSELKKAIPDISEKMLIQQLRQMEDDKLINRKSHPVVPPYVEYSLSQSGQDLKPVLNAMVNWAVKNNLW